MSSPGRITFKTMGQLLHPGTCAVCGSATRDEGYVDLDTFYEWEGQVYLCATCVIEASDLLGCLTPEEARLLTRLTAETAAENTRIKEQLSNASARLDAYDFAVSGLRDSLPTKPIAVEKQSAQPVVTDEPVSDGTTEQPVDAEPVKSSGVSSDTTRTTGGDPSPRPVQFSI